VKFEALATAANVHHILIFGCSAADDSTYRYLVQLFLVILVTCLLQSGIDYLIQLLA